MVTAVFSDLVESAGIFERLGDVSAGHLVTHMTGALAATFEQYDGRVVKLLGDGLFVVFSAECDALAACVAIQKSFHENPVYPGGAKDPVRVRMGVESGEVVEINGDCYGDAVNSAARLADLAGPAQIFTTQRVRAALAPPQQGQLRRLGPMYLRGKSGSLEVFRVDWCGGFDADATMTSVSLFKAAGDRGLEMSWAGQTLRLEAGEGRLSLGRSDTASLSIQDARVSRAHAAVQWQGGHFVLSDLSSFGTWVYMGGHDEPVVLRRTQCCLVGHGEIALGCERTSDHAPVLRFEVKA